MSGSEATVHDRRWTVEDLARIDDETHIYEIVDGRLDVSPRPALPHVRAATRLTTHLSMICPDDVEVLHEPGLVMNRERTHYRIPDVTVFRAEPITMAQIEWPPLLAVEVLSPESTLRDHHTKRREYAAFGIAGYWIVDPSLETPGIIEFRLRDGEYREITQALGTDTFMADAPFPVRLVPHWLVADGPWRRHISGTPS